MFDNEVIGYRCVMAGLGATCAILVLLCYANTKERVNTPIDNSISFFTQIKLMFKMNRLLSCVQVSF